MSVLLRVGHDIEGPLVKSRGRFGDLAEEVVDSSQSRALPLLCPVALVDPGTFGVGDVQLGCGREKLLMHPALHVSSHSSWLQLLQPVVGPQHLSVPCK